MDVSKEESPSHMDIHPRLEAIVQEYREFYAQIRRCTTKGGKEEIATALSMLTETCSKITLTSIEYATACTDQKRLTAKYADAIQERSGELQILDKTYEDLNAKLETLRTDVEICPSKSVNLLLKRGTSRF